MRVLVIGAGVGGLTSAALLAKAGLDVTVLEAHTYPGGSAGTFVHQGYRFDAGATLLAGFDAGGIFSRLEQHLNIAFPVRRLSEGEALIEVWLPGDQTVTRPIGRSYEQAAQLEAFGSQVRPFWDWQAQRALALWAVAEGLPFPPSGLDEWTRLVHKGLPWAKQNIWALPGILTDFIRSTASHAPELSNFRRFLDAQLLIASQADSRQTYGLFGAAALDLPHRGPVMPQGGMGAIAQTLATAIEHYGGKVLYRHQAEKLYVKNNKAVGVEAVLGGRRRGERTTLEADFFIANLTPVNLAALYPVPQNLTLPNDGWGAFMVHAALPNAAIPKGAPYRQWAGDGDWAFISLSDEQDLTRAPAGQRVLSASVHTPLKEWQGLSNEEYAAKKQMWQQRVEGSLERIVPGFRESARLILGATPRTYAFYTRRKEGWVGGYPQTHPLRTPSPRSPFSNLWRVGETVFPGQSVPAVAMGGLRVAQSVAHRLDIPLIPF